MLQMSQQGLTGTSVAFLDYLREIPFFVQEVLPRLVRLGPMSPHEINELLRRSMSAPAQYDAIGLAELCGGWPLLATVVGSNIGALAGLPSWKKLLDRLRAELEKRGQSGDKEAAEDVAGMLKKGHLATAAGFLARSLGGPACDQVIADAWKTPEPLPESAKVLGRIPIRATAGGCTTC